MHRFLWITYLFSLISFLLSPNYLRFVLHFCEIFLIFNGIDRSFSLIIGGMNFWKYDSCTTSAMHHCIWYVIIGSLIQTLLARRVSFTLEAFSLQRELNVSDAWLIFLNYLETRTPYCCEYSVAWHSVRLTLQSHKARVKFREKKLLAAFLNKILIYLRIKHD